MFFLHLLTALTTFFTSILHPSPSVLINQQQTHVLSAVISQTPHVSPTITIPLKVTPKYEQVLAAAVTSAPLIDCVGPDGKHLRLTKQACQDFNNSWKNTNNPQATPYGNATKIGNHTYELQLPPDDRMATPQEILTALNDYRRKNGVGTVTWNDTLSGYAQSRADGYNSNHALDGHAGFTNFINNQNGFSKLGFNHLGENAAYAGPLNATHLIQWVFGADSEHNSNQLNNEWQYVGIGVSGVASDLVFASDPR